MKKLLLLLFVSILALPALSQDRHLKFMGIPLNGSITNFQAKLNVKGVKYDAQLSSSLGDGCRGFNGIFSGEKATIYVYYNNKTKIVYRAKAVIECISKEKGEEKLKDFSTMLQDKYGSDNASFSEQDGHPSFILYVYDDEDKLGYVGLYITNPEFSFQKQCYLHVDYVDYLNSMGDYLKKMDDL